MKLVLPAEYPHSPPKGFFLTRIFHPNISKSGEICVNTLKKDWRKDLGIGHVLQVPPPAARFGGERGCGWRWAGGRIGAQGILPPRTAFPSLPHPPPSPAPRPPHHLPPAPPLPQVVRCLMINPFPESALNEEAGKLFMEEYNE